MTFITYADLIRDTQALARRIGPFSAVVGIPRSGMLPAAVFAETANCLLGSIDMFLKGELYLAGPGYGTLGVEPNVLILDDSLHAGAAMDLTKRRMAAGACHRYPPVKYGAVHVTPGNEEKVDFYGRLVPSPRLFEWNWLRHKMLEDTMFDMDGVICENPHKPEEQFQDDEFRQHLRNVKPLHVPRRRVAEIVTGRLLGYRRETEQWLTANGAACRALTMYPQDLDHRRAAGAAWFKAEVYRKSKASLFVESSAAEAKVIAEIAKKPVLCVEDWRVY